MNTRQWISILMLGFLLAGVSACYLSDKYHSFQPIPLTGWAKNDTLFFTLPQSQADNARYGLSLELRHNGNYPYRTLWLTVSHNTPDSMTFVTDTIECQLTNESGHFTGSGLNNLYQQAYQLADLTLNGSYAPVIKITHYMRDDTLRGICDIGIRLSSSPHQSE